MKKIILSVFLLLALIGLTLCGAASAETFTAMIARDSVTEQH